MQSFEKKLKYNKDKLEETKNKLIAIFGPDKLNINSVTELPEMKQVHSKQYYQRELILRGNYAAATDMLRAIILKNHGGIYSDYDIAPAYTSNVYQILQDNSKNFDFLEQEPLRRAMTDELLSLVSEEPSAGTKNQLSIEDKQRLELILNEIKKEKKYFLQYKLK
ncbi:MULTISPECIES: TcdA/TcdB catalytic glycosyltransferase domain-containing protein [Providencia]|uniref:TcdA/TcdB catalytic glycosyltransferase domain-containing protein n=1 Tax=Providencia TaxID=586 RepID=UPI001E4B76BF|nr:MULTISPECIES: TcdA/TcdB catalytic glycosyltransferase domain-containing protein [Providencia]